MTAFNDAEAALRALSASRGSTRPLDEQGYMEGAATGPRAAHVVLHALSGTVASGWVA